VTQKQVDEFLAALKIVRKKEPGFCCLVDMLIADHSQLQTEHVELIEIKNNLVRENWELVDKLKTKQ
jgi:hypothetical protein